MKKQIHKEKIVLQPQILFPEEGSSVVKQRPAHSDPLSQGKWPKGRTKTLVETATGKRVLSSDVRLHLEKLQRQQKEDEEKDKRKQIVTTVNDELRSLDLERQLLAEKIKKKKEILRLQKELSDVSEGWATSEY